MRKLAVVAAWTPQVSHVIMTELGLEAGILTCLLGVEHRVTILVNENLRVISCLHCFFVLVRVALRKLAVAIVLVVNAVIMAMLALVVIVDPVVRVGDQIRLLLLHFRLVVVKTHQVVHRGHFFR